MSIKLSYHLKHSKSMPRRIVTLETDDFSLEGNAILLHSLVAGGSL